MTTLSLLLITASSFHGVPQGELLNFSAEWCGPCQKMSPIVSRLQRQGYPIRKIDVDKNSELANKYGVESIPTFVLVVNAFDAIFVRQLRILVDVNFPDRPPKPRSIGTSRPG